MPLKFQLGIVDQGHLSAKCRDLGREGPQGYYLLGVTWKGRGVTMFGFLLGMVLLAQMQVYGGALPEAVCSGDQSSNPVTRSGVL